MKIYTKRFIHLLEYEKECTAFLEDQARNGYELNHIGLLFTHFKSCQKPLKYQIDYNKKPTEEYWSMIEQLGYKHIDSYEATHIFSNEDCHAPNLQTDQEIYQQIMLERNPLWVIIISIIAGLSLCLFSVYYLIDFAPYNLGNFYLHYPSLFNFILSFIAGLVFLNDAVLLYFKRKSIENDTYTLSHWNKIDIWSSRITYTIFILSLFAMTIADSTLIKLCVFSSILGMTVSSAARTFTFSKNPYNFKRNILYIGITIICLIISFVWILKTRTPLFKDVPAPFEQSYTFIQKNFNFFVFSIDGICDDTVYDEDIQENVIADQRPSLYHKCRNKSIAKEILKYEIIETERTTRMSQSELFYQSYDNPSSFSKKPKETKSLSYEKAFTKYKKYNSQYFDECYSIDDFIVARYQDVVVRLIVDNINNPDQTLKNYINF